MCVLVKQIAKTSKHKQFDVKVVEEGKYGERYDVRFHGVNC
jgi:hypothetical protein